MYLFVTKNYRYLFFGLILTVLTAPISCGTDDGDGSSGGKGSYIAKLNFPDEIPRLEPDADGIDCDSAGIHTISCTLYSAEGTQIKNDIWQCSHGGGTLTDIPLGTGYVIEIAAEDEEGAAFLWGEDRDITIKAGQRTEGGVIEMHPDNPEDSPTDEVDVDGFSIEGLKMDFVLIPAGTFQMGSPLDEPGRKPDEERHEVTITEDYYMQTTEVTQAQWIAVMGGNPSYFQTCGRQCPVDNVPYYLISHFIDTMAEAYPDYACRLPTEAEWERAARAEMDYAFCNGPMLSDAEQEDCLSDSNLNIVGWYCGNAEGWPHPVGPYGNMAPNDYGLYDMHGNVMEWCSDWYAEYPDGPLEDVGGPTSPQTHRVARGGCWYDFAKDCRSAARSGFLPDSTPNPGAFGFRLVCSQVNR